jgi:repressor LexA
MVKSAGSEVRPARGGLKIPDTSTQLYSAGKGKKKVSGLPLLNKTETETLRYKETDMRQSRAVGRRKVIQLSPKQQNMLKFIEEFINENDGLPPTVREIQQALSISSTSVVDYNLEALETKGFITRTGGKSRAINLKNRVRPGQGEEIPLLGVIAAGLPIPDIKDVTPEDTIEIPRHMFGNRRPADVFALRVKGQSMVDALIDDGDIVLIKPQQTAEVGEVVAVWLEQERETTLKKWYPDPVENKVRLQPANPTMQPIFTQLSNARVMGKLVGVIRTSL